MKTVVSIKTIYNCSLEKAFKTPILCDVSKVHTGYGIMPRVTHCTDDKNWGQPGFSKKVFVAKSFTQKGGWASEDKVIERIENKYWKIEVSQFQSWMLGFSKFTGEWKTSEIEKDKVLVEYTYTLHSDIALLYPLNWLFAKTFWKAYMKRVLENIRQLAYNNEPYLYE
ncbi:MAG: SRPBCC family protein [Chitinophagaceae bacterium]